MTQIQEVVKTMFKNNESGGIVVIVVAYALAAVVKVAQGSSTVSMIITASLISSIANPFPHRTALVLAPHIWFQ